MSSPEYRDDGDGKKSRMPGWFLGKERIIGQIQGMFYVPSQKRFCMEDGTILPYTFEYPEELFTPSDQPQAWVRLSPFDFPTVETVATVQKIIEQNVPKLTGGPTLQLEYEEDPKGRDYFVFTNPNGVSEKASVGLIARILLMAGAATMVVNLRSDLKKAGVVD